MATNATNEPKSVKVTAEADSLFGKIAHFVKEVGEHIEVDIETEVGKVRRFFHKDKVELVPLAAPTKVMVSDIAASKASIVSVPEVTAGSPAVDTTSTETEPAKPAVNPPAKNTSAEGAVSNEPPSSQA